MDLSNKKIWDLNLKEIEYSYKNLHMNNYVYASLKTYHESNPPLNKIISLKNSMIPRCLQEYSKKLVELSPYLGNDDPRTIRINYTYYAFNLFTMLKYIKLEEVPVITEFLATMAYIPIIAEKNDNILLWSYEVTRKMDESNIMKFNLIKDKKNIDEILPFIILENENYEEIKNDPYIKIPTFVIRAATNIIIMSENNHNKEKITEAWENLESVMIANEYTDDPKKMIKRGQLRYQNTLYLYGGDFFRRINEYERAFSWYTRGIYFNELPDQIFKFYLTDMKTTERLILAYSILQNKKEKAFLKNLIDKCILQIFKNASEYSENILDFIGNNPGIDMSLARLPDGDKFRLFSGEASREIFLISLLYNCFVNNIDFKNIQYDKFFIF